MSKSTRATTALRGGIAALALMAMTATAAAPQELMGRSRIELQLGVAVPGSSSTVGVGAVVSEVQSTGALGAIAFSHWVRERVALGFSARVIGVDVESSVSFANVTTRTATIVPLFGGVRWYFTEPPAAERYRPYASLSAGPVFGSESSTSVASVIIVESRTRTAFGARIGAGLDVPFASRWMFGVFGGFNGMTDFSDPIGGQKNHSTPDFGVSISLLFGGGNR